MAWCSAGLLAAAMTMGATGQAAQAPADDWATLLLARFDSEPIQATSPVGVKLFFEGAKLAKGRFGQALNCAAGGQTRGVIPSDAQPSETFTAECWLRLEKRGDERLQRILGRSSCWGFYIAGRKPIVTFYTKVKPGARENWKGCNAPIKLNTWTHLAGTFDGRKMRLYVNGKLVGEADNPGQLVDTNAPLYLGAEADSDKFRFLGQIDEVRLSRVARTTFMTGRPIERPKPTTRLAPADLKAKAFLPTIHVSRTTTPPTVDGRLDDALWRSIAPARFVKAGDAQKPKAQSMVRAAYDREHLYLAFRCFEKGQETQRPGPAGRDQTALFKGDSVEIFLQPAGPGKPYYQIAVNTAGGIFDLRWPKPRQQEKWDGQGIRVAGDVRPDDWSIEVAIPFKDLGVRAPGRGREWRANFCRTEVPSSELTAWAPTGGGYHVTSRFGVLKFGVKPAQKTTAGSHELHGVILDEQGEPVSGVPVRTVAGLARTDAMGMFRLTDLPGGDVAVRIDSPRYHPVAGTVGIKQPVERLAPIQLKRVDPYVPAYKGPVGAGPVAWLASSMVEPPDMERKPTDADLADGLALVATPGEYESRAVAFFANQALPSPTARVVGLHADENRLPDAAVQVRWTQRLLKRVQYRRAREDAVFSWRFLWREAPERVAAGQVRQLVVTVKVPEKTTPGEYWGKLQLASAGKTVATLPVALRVPGFRLATPAKRVGAYYSTRHAGQWLGEEQIERELTDMREHGCRVLVWHASIYSKKNADGAIEYDTSHVRRAVELQKKHGIGPPFIVGTSPRRAAALAGLRVQMTAEFAEQVLASKEFRRIYGGAVAELQKLEKELGAGEFVYTWMDEVLNRGRLDAYIAFAKITRELAKNRFYITFHNRKQAPVDRIAPWVDIRGYHGHTIDWWIAEGHSFDELKREIEADGDEAWNYYNIRDITVTSEYARLCNGYWLWASPLTAHTPWKYYSYGGSPFDDLDSDHHDFAYAAPHPTKPEMVSSLEWECFREGYDDLRYVTTLEKALAAAKKTAPKHAAVAKAEALLGALRAGDLRVPAQAERLSGADYAQRRVDMTNAIEALGRLAK